MKKLFNIKKCQKKFPKNPQFLVPIYIKVLKFLINPKTFLYKGTKHKKNYMEGLNSKFKNKNKNIEGGGSP